MSEIYESLATTVTCPVCGHDFRFYAAVFVIGQDTAYCSKRCAFDNDGTPDA